MPETEAETRAGAPFSSLHAMRAAHRDLLKQARAETPTAAGWIVDFLAKGRATGVLLDEPTERADAQSLLDYWTARLYDFRQEVGDNSLADFDPSRAPDLKNVKCPYIGLSAFQEADRDNFYGREALIEEMLGELKDHAGLLVTGPSGSGKSSLVLAGLLPALRDGRLPDSASWRYYGPLLPGADPLVNLSRLMKPAAADLRSWIAEQVPQFLQNPRHLLALLNEGGPTPALLVIDQAEEVFTLCGDEQARRAFIDNLLAVVQTPGTRHKLVVTLRSDFLDKALEIPALKGLANSAQMVVRPAPLTPEQLLRAIEEPARRVGLKFDEGVVNDLVKAVADEPAGLPLLQFTLRKLWEERSRNRVTWAAYRALGGPREALARAANELYASMLPESQETMRRLFLRLVRPLEEGLEFTRNRVRRESLYPLATRDRVNGVVERLAQADLVRITSGETRDDDRIEVTHEALIRNWPLLGRWLDDDRGRLMQRLRVTTASRFWEAHKEDPGGLLGGSLLEEAKGYGDLDPLETRFVQASEAAARAAEAAARRVEAEKEAARQRELEQARALANAQAQRAREHARSARRLRVLVALLVAFILVAAGAGVLAWVWYSRAETLEKENERQKAEAARAQLARVVAGQLVQAARRQRSNRDLSLVLSLKAEAALRASGQPVTPEVIELVEQALLVPRLTLPGHSRTILGIALPHARSSSVLGIAFSGDGKRLATAGADGTAKVWDGATGRCLQTLTGHTDQVLGVAFSPDGRRVVTAGADKMAIVWETESGRRLQTLAGHKERVVAAVFSPDGRRVATGSEDGTARVWAVDSGKELLLLSEPPSDAPRRVYAVAFDPTGKRLATAGASLVVRVWDAEKGRPIASSARCASRLTAVVFSPDGRRLATADQDGAVQDWDGDSGDLLHSFSGGLRTWQAGVAFTPDGRHLACSGMPGIFLNVRLWDVEADDLVRTTRVPGPGQGLPTAFAFNEAVDQFAVAFKGLVPGPWDPPGSNPVEVYAFRTLGDPIDRAREQVRRRRLRLSLAQCEDVLQDIDPERARRLEVARSAVRRGQTEEALAAARDALALPGLEEDAGEDAKRLVAEVLKEQGQALARKEKVPEAVAAFAEARRLDPGLELVPRQEAGRIAAQSLIDRGGVLAARAAVVDHDRVIVKPEVVDEAAALYRKALELDPGRRLQPEAEAKRRAAQGVIALGLQQTREGKVEAGVKAFAFAQQYDPTLQVSASDWDALCRWGTLSGRAKDVLFAGDRAVEREPDNGEFHDTRGLARALTGDAAGAIQDFEAYVTWARDQRELKEQIAKRRAWIESLRAKKNPFTDKTLEQLRGEGNPP